MKTAIKIFGIPVWEKQQAEGIAEEQRPEIAGQAAPPEPQAHYGYDGYTGYTSMFSVNFDGEKNPGDLGPIRQYNIDHQALSMRAWQLFIESEICQTVFKRFTRWVIGSGLKLQATPEKTVLAGEKITIVSEEFNQPVEARFKVYANSRIPDYASMQNLHQIAEEAFMNSKVGGDVLVVTRVIEGEVTVQLIDGAHLGTPLGLSKKGNDYVTESGSRIRLGIEIDSRNQPIAYHVRTSEDQLKYERLLACEPKTGYLMVFMVYGLKYRLDNIRGISLITAVMETAKKLERYKEAVVGSAEERQKIPLVIEHGVTSTGENPYLKQIAASNGFGQPEAGESGIVLQDRVAATTNKQVVNLPNDSKLVQLSSTNELNFEAFYTPNINIVCATVGIPPNVAMMLYDSNFSASRAALKDWEHTLNVERTQFAAQFYQPIYRLWLYTQILSNKVTAPGFLDALHKKNRMAIEAYVTARWVGANVPHIDPLKEVNAERAKLGEGSKHLPLTTVEAATEALNGGDSYSNMEQYANELKKGDELGIEKEAPPEPPGTSAPGDSE